MNPLSLVNIPPGGDPCLKHQSVNMETARSAPMVAWSGLTRKFRK
jgi:hypothetical protein